MLAADQKQTFENQITIAMVHQTGGLKGSKQQQNKIITTISNSEKCIHQNGEANDSVATNY